MVKEYSCGVIIFRKNEKIEFLLVQQRNKYWSFPKGHIEEGETEIETAKREIFEETGIKDMKILDRYKENISYNYTEGEKKIEKTVTFFLAEVKKVEVILNDEHIDHKWVTFETGIQMLEYKDKTQLLTKANERINNG